MNPVQHRCIPMEFRRPPALPRAPVVNRWFLHAGAAGPGRMAKARRSSPQKHAKPSGRATRRAAKAARAPKAVRAAKVPAGRGGAASKARPPQRRPAGEGRVTQVIRAGGLPRVRWPFGRRPSDVEPAIVAAPHVEEAPSGISDISGILLLGERHPSDGGKSDDALAGALRILGLHVDLLRPRLRRPRWTRRVVHALGPHLNPCWKAADVVTVDGLEPLLRPDLAGRSRWGMRRWRRQVRRSLRRGLVVTASENGKAALLQAFPEADARRIHVIPPGVDLEASSPGDAAPWTRGLRRNGFLNVVCAVDGDPRHQIDVLAEAAAASPYVNLVHVGPKTATSGPLLRAQVALRHMAKEGRYRAVGVLPEAAVRDVLAAADIVVHASEGDGAAAAALRSLAVGAAVLASDLPEHREVLGDAVHWFTDARSLADEFERAWTGVTPTLDHFPAAEVRRRQASRFPHSRVGERHQTVYGLVRRKG